MVQKLGDRDEVSYARVSALLGAYSKWMGATTVASIMVSLLDYANFVCCPRKFVISLLPQPLITKPMPPFGRAYGVWALRAHDKSLAQFLSEIVATIVISAFVKVSLWDYNKKLFAQLR